MYAPPATIRPISIWGVSESQLQRHLSGLATITAKVTPNVRGGTGTHLGSIMTPRRFGFVSQTANGAGRLASLIWSESGGIIRIEWVAHTLAERVVLVAEVVTIKAAAVLVRADVLVQGGRDLFGKVNLNKSSARDNPHDFGQAASFRAISALCEVPSRWISPVSAAQLTRLWLSEWLAGALDPSARHAGSGPRLRTGSVVDFCSANSAYRFGQPTCGSAPRRTRANPGRRRRRRRVSQSSGRPVAAIRRGVLRRHHEHRFLSLLRTDDLYLNYLARFVKPGGPWELRAPG